VRLLLRSHANSIALRQAEELVDELEHGDLARVLALEPMIDAALLVASEASARSGLGGRPDLSGQSATRWRMHQGIQ
jgi:hypothetical protein